MPTENASSPENLAAIRHPLAHVLAPAVLKPYPAPTIPNGPPIDTGCYYDFLFSTPISEEAFPAIEKEMKKIIYQAQTFRRDELKPKDAKKFWKEKEQPFKVELIEDLEKNENVEMVTHYVNIGPKGEEAFVDLCRGGHTETTKDIPVDAFKLMTLWETLGLLVFGYPFYVALAGKPVSPTLLLVGIGLIAAFINGTYAVLLTDLFPTRIRFSGVALAFNISFTLFSGTAPLIATWLIGRTGSNDAPALILVVCGVMTLVASFLHPKYSGHLLHPKA